MWVPFEKLTEEEIDEHNAMLDKARVSLLKHKHDLEESYRAQTPWYIRAWHTICIELDWRGRKIIRVLRGRRV